MASEVRTCLHRLNADVQYIQNDGQGPPVIIVDGLKGPSILSLTNQVIRVSCPSCFQKIRDQLLLHQLNPNIGLNS